MLFSLIIFCSDTIDDLTSLISKLESPITLGSFSQDYRCTIGASNGTMEVCLSRPSKFTKHSLHIHQVAVKVITIDYNRAMPKLEKVSFLMTVLTERTDG